GPSWFRARARPSTWTPWRHCAASTWRPTRCRLASSSSTRSRATRWARCSSGSWLPSGRVRREPRETAAMIRLSVLYPKTDGAKFDHDYYCNSHVPLAVSTWGVERVEIDKGLNGPYEAAV